MQMIPESGSFQPETAPIIPQPHGETCETGETQLLLQAFEMFTRASSSLESAFQQLQERAKRLSEELEVRNRELRKSVREKAEVQNYLNRILESLPCGVLLLDAHGRIKLCNSVAAHLLEEPLRKPGGAAKRLRPLRDAGIRRYFASVPAQDEKVESELLVSAQGNRKVLATSGTPLTDAAGVQTGTLHIIRDVTHLKTLEEQNKRGERLSAMGEMAVELAHEIRNPLGSIELFASLLQREVPADSDPGRWAENIRVASRSLNNIVFNMLHFANPLTPNFAELNVHGVIEEILRFTDSIMCQRQVRIEKQLKAQHSVLYGDRELLKQMMLNLVLNSMQAMPSEGSLSIATRDVDGLPGVACRCLELQIRDTGLGIPAENLARIFDPFFTTNKNGTGLGLSVVHQIVERHSGRIEVASEVNVGTVFTVVLPSERLVSNAA